MVLTDYSWIISIAILIGFPLVLTFLSEKKFNFIAILTYMTIINAFLVSTTYLPLWTQVLFLIITVGLGIIDYKSNKSSSGVII